jgi:hypothetical protein
MIPEVPVILETSNNNNNSSSSNSNLQMFITGTLFNQTVSNATSPATGPGVAGLTPCLPLTVAVFIVKGITKKIVLPGVAIQPIEVEAEETRIRPPTPVLQPLILDRLSSDAALWRTTLMYPRVSLEQGSSCQQLPT